MKVQTELKDVALSERTKKIVGKKIRKACRTRWLSLEQSVNSVYGGEYWTKMLLDRTIRCIISNLPVYCLTVPSMLLCRTQ